MLSVIGKDNKGKFYKVRIATFYIGWLYDGFVGSYRIDIIIRRGI